MFQLRYRNKGVTLVELLITLALIGIVISLIFTLQFFSVKTFSKGDNQSNIQYRIRMAADFMTKELRNATEINILDNINTIVLQKRYFYIKSNKLMYHFSSTLDTTNDKDVLGPLPTNLILTVDFFKNTGTTVNDNDKKILNYNIKAKYTDKEENFDVTSAIFQMNTNKDRSNDIKGLPKGRVVEYSTPLTDQETVDVDQLLLELKGYNLDSTDGSVVNLTLKPPIPNSLLLPDLGKNGSTITWESNNNIIKIDGNVTRPGVGMPDETVTLTAKLTKDDAKATKVFTVKIEALELLKFKLNIESPPLPVATIGSAYHYEFTAIGGTGVYTFSMPTAEGDNLSTHVLTLNANGTLGTLEGTVIGPVGSYTYTITVQDDFKNDGIVNNGLPSPNEYPPQTVTLVIK